jgi:type I restriction enzyme S subunit
MNKIIKYPVYKDSGVQWMANVPSHWELKKFKRVFYEIKRRSNVGLNCGSISFGNVVYKDDEKIPVSTKKSYQVVLKGDFLVNPLNLNYDLISLRIALSEIDVVVSSGYIVLNSSINLDKNYFKYFLHRFDVAYMKLLGSGVRQTLNYNNIANCDLIFPPLEEQTAIAKFLDHKTALIDQAIEIKQKQIELLKERRQILIHKAVTRGLNPEVKLKDSGVEWIGEIPEHWDVTRLKNLIIDLESGVSVNASESESANGEEIGVLKTSCVYNYIFEPRENKKVFQSDLRRVSCPVKANRIIISRMNAPDLVGASGYVDRDFQNLFLPDRLWQTVFRSNIEINIVWLSKVITTTGFRSCVTAIANGSSPSMKNISKGEFLNLKVPHPPIVDQDAIVEFVEISSQKIAIAISLKEQEIEKLKEYRATLINSAVTGKIKVC